MIWEQKNAAWPSTTTMATHPQILQIFAEAQTPSHLRHSTSSADEKNRLAKRERHGKNLFLFVTAPEKRHQRFAKKHDR